jgi:hypothetical protein
MEPTFNPAAWVIDPPAHAGGSDVIVQVVLLFAQGIKSQNHLREQMEPTFRLNG